jgi:outer membrane protein assembly factor BamD (BamD/ComL family)
MFKLWGYSDWVLHCRTAKLYEQIVRRAYHEYVEPQAQMSIGTARENQKNYLKASKAYELAADRYSDRPRVASEALWKAGEANRKQSAEAEYDQGASVRAIETYNDFIALFTEDSRVPQARDNIIELRTEQARGSFIVAKFYEKYHRYQSALIYYNEVLIKDPDSPYAPDARERMEVLKKTDSRARGGQAKESSE